MAASVASHDPGPAPAGRTTLLRRGSTTALGLPSRRLTAPALCHRPTGTDSGSPPAQPPKVRRGALPASRIPRRWARPNPWAGRSSGVHISIRGGHCVPRLLCGCAAAPGIGFPTLLSFAFAAWNRPAVFSRPCPQGPRTMGSPERPHTPWNALRVGAD